MFVMQSYAIMYKPLKLLMFTHSVQKIRGLNSAVWAQERCKPSSTLFSHARLCSDNGVLNLEREKKNREVRN